MTRKEISDLVKYAVDRLRPVTMYGRGRITEFNSIRSHTYPAVWQETIPGTPDVNVTLTPTLLPVNDNNIVLHIAQLDSEDSLPEAYEAIIDACDLIAQKIIFYLNQPDSGDVTETANFKALITLDGVSRSPFVKRHADNCTGVVLEFVLNTPGTTDLCP